ncbi:MAG: cation diffusion facilitator family transporter [Alphaproteobacteria bacterium]
MGHSHDHSGEHSHANHCPAHGNKNRVRVGIAALLTGLFMLAEVTGGLISGSLALLADAGHMLTDFAALAMAWGAFKLAARPADWKHTFGYDRFSILVAFVNGLTLFAIAVWIVIEAAQRFYTPGEILAGPMLWVAIGGLCVNILVFWILIGADRENLNIRGAILHVLGDLLGSVAAIIAALVIMKTGWMPIDPLLSVLVALLILRSAWGLIKDSAHILLEGAPPGIDRREIRDDLMTEVPDLVDIHHMHAWSITNDRPMMTLEAVAIPEASLETVSRAIKARLKTHFHIDHATVDVSRAPK